MEMKRYTFTLTLIGYGKNPDEAWEGAIEAMGTRRDFGQTPEEFEVEDEEPETDGFICTDCRVDSEGNAIVLCPLHAAAPEMLECLQDVIEWLTSGKVDGVGFDHAQVEDTIRAAIAKAEGRTP